VGGDWRKVEELCMDVVIRGPNEDVWRKSHDTGVM